MATSTNQIDFILNANTKDFEANISNSVKAVENLSNNNDTLSESLEDVSKFMKEAAKVNTDLTKAIKDLSKAFDSSVDSTNKEANALDDVSKEAKDAAKEIKKVSDAAKDIEKNSKAGNLALEAIKDNLGAIPVVGPTATRALDGLEGSFSKLVLAGAGVGAIAGGVAAIGGAAVLAYKNSEKLQKSFSKIGDELGTLATKSDTFKSIGDAISIVTDGIASVIENMNVLNGSTLKKTKEELAEILKYNDEINEIQKEQLQIADLLGKSEEEKTAIIQQNYQDRVTAGVKAVNDLVKKTDEAGERYNNAWKKMENAGFSSIESLEEGIKKLSEEAKNSSVTFGYAYGASQQGQDVYSRLNNLKNILKELINAQKEYNEAWKAYNDNQTNIQEASDNYKEMQKGAKGTVDELEQLKKKLNEAVQVQQIMDDTVINTKEAEEKKNRDLQEQLGYLNRIYVLEEQRGIPNQKTLDKITAIKEALNSEVTDVERLKKSYEDLVKVQDISDDLVDSGDNQEVRQKQINDITEQIAVLEDLYIAQVKAGEPAEETLKTIKKLKTELEKLNDPLDELKAAASQIMSSIQSAYNSIGSAVMNIKSMDLIDTSKFDEQIEHIQNKLDEFDEAQKEKEEEKQELDDEAYQNYLARLDEEYQKAVEANDLMSQEAIRIKKEEVEKKREQEKKELEEEKKINKQREDLEKQLAEAQYNKDYAEWQNQVKLAELQKNKAIADAVVLPALATAQAALGLATSFAQGGPVGFAAGVALSATAIGSAIGAAAGVVSAAAALDSAKGNPPEMPKFEFGTTGYTLGYEETALVGERGPELVKNMGGILQVQSAAQTEAMGNRGGERIGMYIENLVFNVAQRLTAEEIYEVMTTFKARNLRFRR
ncbi:hypothetical protein [uncultured Brachyspira sp.]|uniref:hypothetical protein n=1 Tax=uncultured Brachyspira sp. TaxID=221953 RepID=UPI00260C248D|nr:hypothetical protein [uncultured Brachyspira sp.]